MSEYDSRQASGGEPDAGSRSFADPKAVQQMVRLL